MVGACGLLLAPAPGVAARRRKPVARPDLVVTALTPPPAVVRPGTVLAVRATVRNRGRGRAGRSVVRAYLAPGRRHTRGDVRLLGSIAIPALRGQKRAVGHRSLKVPGTVRSGRFHLIACADDRRAVKEAKEGNNCRAAKPATVVLGSPSPAPVPLPPGPRPPPAPAPSATPTPILTPIPTPTPGPPGPTPGAPGADDQVPAPPAAPAAPALPSTDAPTLADATAFLYTGAHPVQTGVDAGTIDPARVAVLRGRVLAGDGRPLESVTVTVVDHPELGRTVTRSDGRYDFAVNAGGGLTLRFQRAGFLPSDRAVDPAVRAYDVLDDVVLLSYDPRVTTIQPGAAGTQVAQSTLSTDASGSRRASLIFMPGTHGTMHMPDGSSRPLDSMHVRATEYTVGERGPEAMPGDLPPTSAYTYAADYSVDEAVTAGATGVRFDKPVVVYTDNFLGMPVGGTVPLGSYDRGTQAWNPEPNGRVVKIVSITGGRADLDVDGDGSADTGNALSDLGITDAERTELATLYGPGKELWRAQVTHFSSWDQNWPYGPPPDAAPPAPLTPPKPDDPRDPSDPRDPCQAPTGSSVECNSRALRESLPLAGTPFDLDYTSARASARNVRSVDIQLTGPTVPASLSRVELAVTVAGKLTRQDFPAQPNESHTFVWDGRDVYGRTLHSREHATADITYVYPAIYRTPAENAEAFAQFGAGIGADRARLEIRITQRFEFTVGDSAPPPAGLGGWTLDVHHALDPVAQVALLGDGDRLLAPVKAVSNLPVATAFTVQPPAQNHKIWGIAAQPDGSVWYADQPSRFSSDHFPVQIRRTVAGGTPATVATLPLLPGQSSEAANVEVEPAPDGGVYALRQDQFGTTLNGPIYHMARDGTVQALTGDPSAASATPDGGDGQPAAGVVLQDPRQLAVGPDGSIYVGEQLPATSGVRVQRIGPDGVVRTVIDGGSFFGLQDLAVGPDGSIYLAGSTSDGTGVGIWRVMPSGDRIRVLGGGDAPCCDDGQAPGNVDLQGFGEMRIAVMSDGTLLFFVRTRVYEVGEDGLVRRVAGSGLPGSGHDLDQGEPAQSIDVQSLHDIDEGPDGTLYLSAPSSGLRTVAPAVPGFALSYAVPSADGRQVYLFDHAGRHLRTLDALTGATLLSFGYDAAGLLARVTDRDGRVTTIERAADGSPTAIVAPTGERTAVTLDGDGNLASATRPGGLETRLSYGAGGLLTGETDASGAVHQFSYDASGRVTRDEDPDGVVTDVTGADQPGGRRVTLTGPLGHAQSYLDGGDADGTWRRTSTDAAGAQTTATVAGDGTRGATFPDGRTTSVTPGPDPRFGMLAPIDAAATVREPSGLTFTGTATRRTTLSDPTDPFSVTGLTDTWRVSGSSGATTRTYDAAAHTVTTTSSTGRRSIQTLDAKTRTTRLSSDQAEDPQDFTYNDRGLLTQAGQGAQQATYAYDDHDRLSGVTDAAGRATHYTYDPAGRTTNTTLPGGETYGFQHDGMDRLTAVTMPRGGVQHLRWTAAGRPAGYDPPGSGPGYVVADDADGQRRSTTLPSGRAERIDRDGGGRVASVAYPEATVGVDYVGNTGRVASLTRTPAGGGTASSLAFGYDGDLTTSIAWSGPAAGRYDYTYDSAFRLSRAALTAGGSTVTTDITRDDDGLETGEGPFSFGRSGPAGAISSISGGPLAVTQDWDSLGRVAGRHDVVNGTGAYDMVLTRDAAGRITRKVETVGGTVHTYDYDYDADGRLTEVRRDTAVAERYAYDADGNRTSVQLGSGAARSASYDDADRITSQGSTTYDVDGDGQLVRRGTDTFSYSTRGELLSATIGGVTETYAYDGYGRMIARTSGGDTWRFLYGNPDQQLQVTAALEPDGTLDTLDYTDAGNLFSILRGSTRYSVSSDQVGSPLVITDASGTAVKTVAYSAYGETLSDSAPGFQLPVGYAGGIPDPLTGLVHMGVRDYDPSIGRFTTRDPLLLAGGDADLYAYAAGDPIQNSDPLGLLSAGGTVCDLICVGLKWSVTEDGFSACFETGFGEGDGLELTPNGGLDPDKAYLKVSAELNLGPLAGYEVSEELTSDGHCRRHKPSHKACVLGGCVDTGDGLKLDGNKMAEAFSKKGLGVERKVVGGVCQQVLW